MIGHLTEQSLADVRADKIFFGVRVIDITHGLTNDYSPETSTDRAILAIGRRLIVVADHTKCGRIASAVIAPLSDVHTLVTDNAASGDFIAALQARGVRTCIA